MVTQLRVWKMAMSAVCDLLLRTVYEVTDESDPV